ncbi:hypothetical protein I79_015135 [Cricetulus griseus]|uniref:Uncharacterized protein n=1 Tax=Cricetulus griseus TaxID=10029 RepID=G3HVY9_CRIGR|nr:hypothetical protein I79_015135 [Cricetulus griseus]
MASMLVINTKPLCDGLGPKISGEKKTHHAQGFRVFGSQSKNCKYHVSYRMIFIMIRSQGQS